MPELTYRLTLVAFVLFLLQPAEAVSQSVRSGTLSGIVTTNGVPAPNVTVAINSDARVFTTDRRGNFTIPLLPAGDYTLTIEQLGHRPLLLTGVRVGAGSETLVEAELQPVTGNVIAVDTVLFSAGGSPPVSLAPLRADARGWRRAVGARETLADLAGAYGYLLDRSIDGLPFTSGTLYLDGVALPIDPDEGDALDLFRFPFPRLAVGSASLSLNSLTMNAGDAGIAWNLTSLPAPTRPILEWSVTGGRGMGSQSTSPSFGGSLFAGGQLGSSLAGVVSFEGGIDDRRQPALTGLELPTSIAEISRTAYGDTFWSDDPFDLQTTFTNSLAGIDWATGFHSLQLRARLATRDFSAEDLPFSWIPRTGRSSSTTGGISFGLESALSNQLSNVLQGGLESRRRKGDGEASGSPGQFARIVETAVQGVGLSLGSDPFLGSTFERSTASISNQLRLRLPGHRIAASVEASGSRYLVERSSDPTTRFVFGGEQDLELRAGSFTESVATDSGSEFDVAQIAGGLEDRWTPRAGVELLMGLRVQSEWLGRPSALPEPLWFQRTGMTYSSPSSTLSLLPRFGVSVTGGQWQFLASSGLYSESHQPLLLNEIFNETGTTRVRRRIGALAGWPAVPDSVQAPFTGNLLTLTDPDFTSPRTLRGTLSLSRSFGAGSRVGISGNYRWTDRLPRRYDLNRLPGPAGEDQYGRPLYGKLVQEGALVRAQPRSSRRLADFDLVSLLKSDGESRYVGVTLDLEQGLGRTLKLLGTYTFSQTLDNLPLRGSSALAGAAFVPEIEQGEWVSGTSDFDVPHRARIGFELTVPPLRSLEIAAFYRLRSGYPFTPTFQSGVDINGDEIPANEPAFLDSSVSGFSEVAAGWGCINLPAGFAARNSCRSPSVSALDLRLSLPLGGRGELYLDAFELFGDGDLLPDPALYLVDRSATLSTDATGVTTIPLIVNPAFGNPLLSRGTSRSLRIGLDVSL